MTPDKLSGRIQVHIHWQCFPEGLTTKSPGLFAFEADMERYEREDKADKRPVPSRAELRRDLERRIAEAIAPDDAQAPDDPKQPD